MISFLSLITFLLRLTLAIQGQLVTVLPVDSAQERVCLDFNLPSNQVHPIIGTESGNETGRVETESEEKSETESESESFADLLDSLYADSNSCEYSRYYNPFFGSKGVQGDRHLYDLFHSWKTHLS
jgi:hypothetical protein